MFAADDLGCEAQRTHGLQDGLDGLRCMRHGQYPLHQVELHTRHTRHATQFVAQQRFFRGAVHLQDADGRLHARHASAQQAWRMGWAAWCDRGLLVG
jgi:hypothetical protein